MVQLYSTIKEQSYVTVNSQNVNLCKINVCNIICAYFYTLGLLAWNTIVLEKLIVAELLKKFTALYSILMFIITFPGACHLSHISPVQILTLFFNTNFSLHGYYSILYSESIQFNSWHTTCLD